MCNKAPINAPINPNSSGTRSSNSGTITANVGNVGSIGPNTPSNRGVDFDIIYFLRTTFCRNFQIDISMFKFCEFLQFFQNFAAISRMLLKPAIFSFCEFQNFVFFQLEEFKFEIRKI
jgi:hypothetical protein